MSIQVIAEFQTYGRKISIEKDKDGFIIFDGPRQTRTFNNMNRAMDEYYTRLRDFANNNIGIIND